MKLLLTIPILAAIVLLWRYCRDTGREINRYEISTAEDRRRCRARRRER